ncbi:FAD binding domain-containing protein [Candidatus Bipolaricaulota bacterium]|nr:FAD binding domain-containing protein [Candidatus Bipolaricaulota bacterium]
MTSVQTYQRPSSIEEAWSLLAEKGKSAKLVGGGVDVALFVPPEITTLIDLSLLPYRSIQMRDGNLVLGAGVTLTEILESPIVGDYLNGTIVQMMRQVASPLLRNAATIAGSLASMHPWSDIITLFLALDAQVTQYAGQLTTTSLEELMAQRGTIDRAIITEVTLPAPAAGTAASFQEFVRAAIDVSMLNCACRVVLDNGNCSDVRIVFGGTPDIGQRVTAVEDALTGKHLKPAVIESVAKLAGESIPARDDMRASADYRRVLAAAGVRRCLHRIVQRAGE